MTDEHRYLNAAAAALILGVSVKTARNLAAAEGWRHDQGRPRRWHIDDIRRTRTHRKDTP
ncbi:hypothetical protein EV140_1944 [Microcella alkaliphila]|uniref:Helix-turn-helix domain-containing protein n=1 Tax=Microcella alkaliphila TaxID=279828 RepID=A0A4V2FMX9_9MICO|nr:hypothetical protein [Microcella alkaliphila]RZT59339.1 hypothetical protein EV140_1944 [Microcella alkaliphila]